MDSGGTKSGTQLQRDSAATRWSIDTLVICYRSKDPFFWPRQKAHAQNHVKPVSDAGISRGESSYVNRMPDSEKILCFIPDPPEGIK